MSIEKKVTIAIILLTIGIISVGVYLSNKSSETSREKLKLEMLGEKMPDEGSIHVKRDQPHKAYGTNPPTSGPHWEGVAGPGIKSEPVADELVLHSMEHGAAVVWYQEDLVETDLTKAMSAFDSAKGKKIMLARKDLDVPIALTSWGYLLKLDTVDEVAIREFIETNSDRAPEKAPI